jgi:hypothetical protein
MSESKNVVVAAVELPSCSICAEYYTTVVRKKVECNSCHKEVCSKCIEKYMMSNLEDPHCLHCRSGWNRAFLTTFLTAAFLNKTYYAYRQTVLLNREKSFLPQYQVAAEREVKIRSLEREDAAVKERYNLIERKRNEELYAISKERTLLWRKIDNVRMGREETASAGTTVRTVVATKFIRRCPATGCNGFLSSAWKCGICNHWACPDCFEVKGLERDVAHTCTADALATAALIRKDTKPCPSCGEMISKIDGCFAPDTPVLGWNGHTILAKDVKIGDVLIGDDGAPRTVQTICTGEDEMYEVTQTNGMTYVVNSKHRLPLKFSGDREPYWSEDMGVWKIRWFDHNENKMKTKQIGITPDVTKEKAKEMIEELKASIPFPDVIEMFVDDYMKLPPSIQYNLMGFKTQGVSWPSRPVDIDPYMVGLYIGDGIHSGVAFAACAEKDPEILEYLLKWCDENNAELCHEAAYKFRIRGRGRSLGRKAIRHGATSADCIGCKILKCTLCDLPETPYTDDVERDNSNPLKTALAKYNLVENKHIPDEYMMNDRATRLAVLAGLVDTDGYLSNEGKRISISQSKTNIGEQIAFLAHSLGFTVTVRMIEKKGISFNGSEPKDYPDHIAINISGELLHEIPTRVLRKKCVGSLPRKDSLRTSISVKPIGRGIYHGWSLDGNKRFVLKDFTCQKNCDQMFCTSCHKPFSWISGQAITKGAIHNPHYYQWIAKGGAGAPANRGFVPCGGFPNPYHLQSAIHTSSTENRKKLLSLLRQCIHMNEVERHRYERHLDPINNEELGVQFLLKTKSEDDWKAALGRREKDRQKCNEIRDILDAFDGAAIDLFRRFDTTVQYPRKECETLVLSVIEELEALRKFIFQSMTEVSRSFNCSVPLLNEKWELEHGNIRDMNRRLAKAEAEKVAKEAKEAAEAAEGPTGISETTETTATTAPE